MVVIPRERHSAEACKDAKAEELKKLMDFEAFKPVEDVGKARISSTWVLWNKEESVRARLWAHGYEEVHNIPSDSLTVDKPDIFFLHDGSGNFIGCIALHVDNFLHAGTVCFKQEVIRKQKVSSKWASLKRSLLLTQALKLINTTRE